MCGFAGIYDAKKLAKYQIEDFINVIRHRGPDQQKYMHVDDKMCIGFARLAIIDLAGGSQPMTSDDGKVVVMCNGEIYNYVELREKLLQEEVIFKTSSDTEVVLKMYEKYGLDMLNLLEGMYAIAIIDKQKKETLLIRDRFGIKPLYYSYDGKHLYGFASEIKPLLKLPFVSKTIRKESVADFLMYEYIHAPYTIFKDIKKVKAGHYLKITDENIEEIEYWDCRDIVQDENLTMEQCKEQVLTLIRQSLKFHLRSDVKLGFFLSGGIDSGLLVALASEQLNGVDTYTLRFENADFDETDLAKLVANRYHTNHHSYTVKADDFERLLPEMIWYFDEPLGDSGILPNYLLNKLVRENDTKVIITGAGGDELFAGYGYYFGSKKEQLMAGFPHLSGAIAKVVKKAAPDLARKMERASTLKKNPIKHMIMNEQAFSEDEICRLLESAFPPNNTKQEYYDKCNNNELNRMLYVDLKTYLSDDLLLLADRSSMAASVEGRVPFLYRPLVEFAMTIPKNIKAPNGSLKCLLKKASQDFLPPDVLKAPKMGFSSPIQRWQKMGMGDFAYDILNSSRSIEREFWNRAEYVRFVSDKKNYDKHFNKIYLLLILELYLRIHCDNEFQTAESIERESIYG